MSVCLVSHFNHLIHYTTPNNVYHGCNPHIQLCCSIQKFRFLVDMLVVSISQPHITLFSNECIHKICRKLNLWHWGQGHWESNLPRIFSKCSYGINLKLLHWLILKLSSCPCCLPNRVTTIMNTEYLFYIKINNLVCSAYVKNQSRWQESSFYSCNHEIVFNLNLKVRYISIRSSTACITQYTMHNIYSSLTTSEKIYTFLTFDFRVFEFVLSVCSERQSFFSFRGGASHWVTVKKISLWAPPL